MNEIESTQVLVIGCGAAGLMAALSAARAGVDVIALDGASKIGTKIRVSGGGRCNLTHDKVSAKDYFTQGSARDVAHVLAALPVARTKALFESLGVVLKREEQGKIFPQDDRSSTVLNALLSGAQQSGAQLKTGQRVVSVTYENERWQVRTQDRAYAASCVILAAGGEALPSSGSDGFGIELAKCLGLETTETWPALAPLVLAEKNPLLSLSGTALEAVMYLQDQRGKRMHQEGSWGDDEESRYSRSLLLTHFGLSGPLAMNISRHLPAHPDCSLCMALTPSFEEADRKVRELCAARPKAQLRSVLSEMVPERFVPVWCARVRVDADQPAGQLSRQDRRDLVHGLCQWQLTVTSSRGFTYAEATAGGVSLSEVSSKTLQSHKHPGLYIAGELLDVDGRIGGWNFQWAWSSGWLAGQSAARAAKR